MKIPRHEVALSAQSRVIRGSSPQARKIIPVFAFAIVAGACVHADRERASVQDELTRRTQAELAARPERTSSSTGSPGSRAVEPNPAEAFDRREMIAAYLVASPELAGFDAELGSRLAEIDLAGTFDAPELMVQAWNVPFRRPYALDDASMWMAIVSQRFEPRGVRRDRVRERSAEARAVLAERTGVALEIARRAAADHASLAAFDAMIAARENARSAFANLVVASESLVASGRTDARMLVEVRAEAARVDASLEASRARRAAVARVANARMARDPSLPLVIRVDESTVDADAVRTRLESHPSLAANDARTEAAEARVAAATHASRRPSISAGLGVFEEPHAGVGYGFQVGLSLPWIGGRARAERRVAEAEAARVEADRTIARRTILVELESALAELQAADSALRAIDETTLPAHENAARATANGLASGTTSIRDVLAVYASLAEHRIERAEWLGARLSAESSLYAWIAVLDGGAAIDSETTP